MYHVVAYPGLRAITDIGVPLSLVKQIHRRFTGSALQRAGSGAYDKRRGQERMLIRTLSSALRHGQATQQQLRSPLADLVERLANRGQDRRVRRVALNVVEADDADILRDAP